MLHDAHVFSLLARTTRRWLLCCQCGYKSQRASVFFRSMRGEYGTIKATLLCHVQNIASTRSGLALWKLWMSSDIRAFLLYSCYASCGGILSSHPRRRARGRFQSPGKQWFGTKNDRLVLEETETTLVIKWILIPRFHHNISLYLPRV